MRRAGHSGRVGFLLGLEVMGQQGLPCQWQGQQGMALARLGLPKGCQGASCWYRRQLGPGTLAAEGQVCPGEGALSPDQGPDS